MSDFFTVLGWENRFYAGIEQVFNKDLAIENINLIIFSDYLECMQMQKNLDLLKETCEKKSIKIKTIDLQYKDSVLNWNTLNSFFQKNEASKPILNLTTMPRETIWTLLFFLRQQHKEINYIYFKPSSYTNDWLTKNFKEPRLLFKHSGIFDLDKELALISIRGFDKARLQQLIDYFEPNYLEIYTQKTNSFESERVDLTYENYVGIKLNTFKIDSYDFDSAFKVLNASIKELTKKYNVIIASQGPKLSSLYAYKCYLENPEIALAYVPATEFNLNYSDGCDMTAIEGSFIF